MSYIEGLSEFCERTVRNTPLDGETGKALTCYVRIRTGLRARGRQVVGRVAVGDDANRLCDELTERAQAASGPGLKLWFEAIVKRETTPFDSLLVGPLDLDDAGEPFDDEPGKGTDSAIRWLTGALVEQSRSADDRATRSEMRAQQLTERVITLIETLGEQRSELVLAQLDAGADNGMGEAIAGLLPIAAVVGAKLLGVGGQEQGAPGEPTPAPAETTGEGAEPDAPMPSSELAAEVVELLQSDPEALALVQAHLAQAGAACA